MKYVNRKSMIIRESGRSSDYITPSFGFGCLYKCSYCYMRRHVPNGLTIAQNPEDILIAIENHSEELSWPKTPNQTHNEYYTYDFSCNEDFILHSKYHNWRLVFDYFKYHEKALGTAATKYVNKELLNYDANRKIRIRFSLMPQKLSDRLEPNTSKIIDRIKAVNDFYEAGYDVHLNYSPVIVNKESNKMYADLFDTVNKYVDDEIKDKIKCEVIFLTHNKKMHEYNLINDKGVEDLLWDSDIQETKVSQYGSVNIRYKYNYKSKCISGFKSLHNRILPWQKIRYIF